MATFPVPNEVKPEQIKFVADAFPTISDIKKRRMIAALAANLGIVTTAAALVPIHPDTHYQWLKDFPEYKRAVQMIANMSLDFAESQLFKNIAAGDTTAIIFYLKTKGKKRGYIEKTMIGFNPLDDDDEITSTLDI